MALSGLQQVACVSLCFSPKQSYALHPTPCTSHPALHILLFAQAAQGALSGLQEAAERALAFTCDYFISVTWKWRKPTPEYGLDCLHCAILARQRPGQYVYPSLFSLAISLFLPPPLPLFSLSVGRRRTGRCRGCSRRPSAPSPSRAALKVELFFFCITLEPRVV